MLMEGYMMKTEGVAGTQHEIRAKLEELMGEGKTDEFFDYWLENHFTKADVDSIKAWGLTAFVLPCITNGLLHLSRKKLFLEILPGYLRDSR